MIRIDIIGHRNVSTALQKIQMRMPWILKDGVTEASHIVRMAAKKKVTKGRPLHVVSGRLRTSIDSRVYRKGRNTVIGEIGTDVFYGKVHEKGKAIYARRAPYMVFMWRGKLYRTKRVWIPRRPWLAPALFENYRRIVTGFSKAIGRALMIQGF